MKKERFTASRAGRHMACHASADLPAAIPGWTPPADSSGAAAKKGTSKHEILEKLWELPPSELMHMIRVQQYVYDLVKGRRFNKLIEHEFTADWLSSAPPTKPDLVLYTQQELHILDTKMGKHFVDVNNNDQMMYYALCAAPLSPKAKGVTVHILQPAADNFESAFITPDELAAWRDDAIAAHDAIQAGDLAFGPSDHCTFCPANPQSNAPKARPYCPAMMDLLYPKLMDEGAILA